MNMKVVGAFVGGLVIGAVGTWFGVKKHYEDKMYKEIDEARQTFAHLSKQKRESDQAFTPDDIPDPEVLMNDDPYYESDSVTIPGPSVELKPDVVDKPPAYLNILKRAHFDCDQEEIDQMIFEARQNPECKIIDPTEYGDQGECIGLTWLHDDVLIDEVNGYVIPEDEYDELIGRSGIEYLKTNKEDVYIHNEPLHIDIEVIYDEGRTLEEFLEGVE